MLEKFEKKMIDRWCKFNSGLLFLAAGEKSKIVIDTFLTKTEWRKFIANKSLSASPTNLENTRLHCLTTKILFAWIPSFSTTKSSHVYWASFGDAEPHKYHIRRISGIFWSSACLAIVQVGTLYDWGILSFVCWMRHSLRLFIECSCLQASSFVVARISSRPLWQYRRAYWHRSLLPGKKVGSLFVFPHHWYPGHSQDLRHLRAIYWNLVLRNDRAEQAARIVCWGRMPQARAANNGGALLRHYYFGTNTRTPMANELFVALATCPLVWTYEAWAAPHCTVRVQEGLQLRAHPLEITDSNRKRRTTTKSRAHHLAGGRSVHGQLAVGTCWIALG